MSNKSNKISLDSLIIRSEDSRDDLIEDLEVLSNSLPNLVNPELEIKRKSVLYDLNYQEMIYNIDLYKRYMNSSNYNS